MATPKRIAELFTDLDRVGFFHLAFMPCNRRVRGERHPPECSVMTRHKHFGPSFFWLRVRFIAARVGIINTAATRYSLVHSVLTGWISGGLHTACHQERPAHFRHRSYRTLPPGGRVLNGYYLIFVRGVSPSLIRSPGRNLVSIGPPGVYDPEEHFVDIALHGQMVSGRALYLSGRFPDRRPFRPVYSGDVQQSLHQGSGVGLCFNSSTVQPRLPVGWCRQ